MNPTCPSTMATAVRMPAPTKFASAYDRRPGSTQPNWSAANAPSTASAPIIDTSCNKEAPAP
jgi:hypothetical protein